VYLESIELGTRLSNLANLNKKLAVSVFWIIKKLIST